MIHGLFRALFSDLQVLDTVRTLGEALDTAGQQSYDMILMGLSPNSSLSISRFPLDRLRKVEEYSSVPVVVLTTQTGPQERERFLKHGFDGYVAKPFTKERLLEEMVQAYQPPL
jgi:CheY-like chemotaxis protein